MKNVCLIGNNAFGKPVFDGQRIKVRTYKTCLEQEGFHIDFVELDNPLKRFFKILKEIKRGVKKCDTIVLITSDNGEKVLIPFINKVNKKYNRRFIFSQIGTSFLYKHIRKMSEERKNDFFYNHNFSGEKPSKKIAHNLREIDVILTETNLINDTFKEFFDLDNCYCLTNFRNIQMENSSKPIDSNNKLIYLSRIMERKGIFDLIEVLKKPKFVNLSLDIYGSLFMDKNEKALFDSLLDNRIKYLGELAPDKIIETIKRYDLLCFTTKCEGEGTPGCIVESLIAGVPVLSSRFTQSSELLKEGYDSIIYDFENVEDLERKLTMFVNKDIDIKKLKTNAFESGKQFTYAFNRENFLKLISGE